MRAVVLASVMSLSLGCSSSSSTSASTDATVESGLTPAPACEAGPPAPSGSTCGHEITSCDPNHPPGLPTGTCAAGSADCDVTVHMYCPCDSMGGPRFPWHCTCAGGTWSCELQPIDGRVCDMSCDAGAETSPSDASPCTPGQRASYGAAGCGTAAPAISCFDPMDACDGFFDVCGCDGVTETANCGMAAKPWAHMGACP